MVDAPIVTGGGRANAKNGSVEVKLSHSRVCPPLDPCELRSLSLGDGEVLLLGRRPDAPDGEDGHDGDCVWESRWVELVYDNVEEGRSVSTIGVDDQFWCSSSDFKENDFSIQGTNDLGDLTWSLENFRGRGARLLYTSDHQCYIVVYNQDHTMYNYPLPA
jgi:hypothetical protein